MNEAVNACWKNVLWAADPFEDTPQHEAVLQALKILVGKCGSRVSVVHMAAPAADGEAPIPPTVVREALGRWAATLPLALEDTHVLEVRPTEGPDRLATFAAAGGYDLIVLATHGRSGWSRAFLGSFAEAMMTRTKIPLLVLGPNARVAPEFNEILLATDLQESSFADFEKVVGVAEGLHTSVRLFNSVDRPVEAALLSGMQLAGGGWMTMPPDFKEGDEHAQRISTEWERRVSGHAVKVEHDLDQETPLVLDAILAEADRHPDAWLAVVPKSGPVSAAVWGSISRQTMRASSRPVLVFGAAGQA